MVFDLSGLPLAAIIAVFVAAALTILFTGPRLAATADAISQRTHIGQAMIGALLLGATTSLPGIITSVATAGFGYPELSISNAIGGITVQTAFLAFADIAYRGGSLYHAFNDRHVFVMSVAILMTSVLLLGLLKRERHGFGGIGFESTIILLLYAASVVILVR